MKQIDKHNDLIQFEENYNKKINKFLNSESETKVVFLNADYGLGKTTFIEQNLKINKNCIYSPWLNSSSNYLEEIYFHVTKKNKGKLSSLSLFITSIVLIFSVLSGSIIAILTDIFKSDNFICRLNKYNLLCHSGHSLGWLIIIILIFIFILIFIIYMIIFKRPVPLINFFRKENGKYYEDKIIESILKKVPNVLVIEDIDRTDDIEDILLAANKISNYIVEKNLNKYILITGDYIRTIRRLSEPNIYDVQNYNIALLRSKGVFLVEKVIGLRIDFCSLKSRVNNVLNEYNVSQKLKKIEFDELISFMRNHFLGIRFFVKFIESELGKIHQNYNIYYLFVEYFNNEKYFNIDDKRKYDISLKFPSCINDIEMFYQCKTINIKGKNIVNIFEQNRDNSNRSIIVDCIRRIMTFDNTAVDIFQEFYNGDKYPQLITDRPSSTDSMVFIGGTLKPNNFKSDLDNFLIGISNNENGVMGVSFMNKRCYFDADFNTNNFDSYKINNISSSMTEPVDTDTFLIAYIACFFRDNKIEFQRNYPGISKRVSKILSIKITHEEI